MPLESRAGRRRRRARPRPCPSTTRPRERSIESTEPDRTRPLPENVRGGRRWLAPLAGRLPAEAGAVQIAEVAFTLWLEIERALHPVIGHRGVAALYHRSLRQGAAGHPWLLAGAEVPMALVDPSALRATLSQQADGDAAAGTSAHFDAFHDLLTSLVGASLTDRLLLPFWAPTPAAPAAQDSIP